MVQQVGMGAPDRRRHRLKRHRLRPVFEQQRARSFQRGKPAFAGA